MANYTFVGNNSVKGASFAAQLAGLILTNQNVANVGDATGLRGSSAAGNLYLAAHIAEPYTGDAQNSNECVYTGYSRVAVPRDTNTWTRIALQDNFGIFGDFNSTYVLKGLLYLPTVTAYSGGAANALITHLSIGTVQSGAGLLMYACELLSPIQLVPNKRNRLTNITFCEA